jgi:GDP-mannose 4,6-dehydratase
VHVSFETPEHTANADGPTRREAFVTRKISRAVAAIKLGRQQTLFLGNLRDWGHARDYVETMWRILQQPKPDDYVLATGETQSVREFVEKASAQIGMRIAWQDAGADEKGIDAGSGHVLVKVDARYFRPTEVERQRLEKSLAGSPECRSMRLSPRWSLLVSKTLHSGNHVCLPPQI